MQQLSVEILAQIFAFCFLTGRPNHSTDLSVVSTELRLVCRLWNAVTISTPSLWVQVCLDPRSRIPPDILSIWLERSKSCSLHVELFLPIKAQHLSVLSSSIERWESFVLYSEELSADLVCRYFPLSCARRLKSLGISHQATEMPQDIIALIETTPNLQYLRISYGLGRHCAYTPLMDSLLNNLSHLRLYADALKCEHTWNMLQHFRGTVLYLDGSFPSRDRHPITFSNLKILSLRMVWDDMLRLLPLLHTSTLEILDLDFASLYGGNPEWLMERLSLKTKLPLLALRIHSFRYADGLDRFFQSPDIQEIPLVEIILPTRFSGELLQKQRSCALGGAIMVEHCVLGTCFGWNRLSDVPRDLADYLSGDVDIPPRYLDNVSPPFKFFVFETMKKVDSGVLENRWCGWDWTNLLHTTNWSDATNRFDRWVE